MTTDEPDDDKCQVSMCEKTHFTYCPHCKLFVCIEHLNEHYSNYRQEYQTLLNDGKQQQVLSKQFIDDIENEKKQIFNVFQREIDYYKYDDTYFHEKMIQTTIRPQDCADLRFHILQTSQKRLKFKKFIHQIQQLINDYEYHQPTESIHETSASLLNIKSEQIANGSRIKKSSPLAQFSIDYEEIDDDDDDDNGHNSNTQQHEQQIINIDAQAKEKNCEIANGNVPNSSKDSNKEVTTTRLVNKRCQSSQSNEDDNEDDDDDSNDNHSISDPDFGNKRRAANTVVRRTKATSSSKPLVNQFRISKCPLTANLYGIDLNKHPLRHVPCQRDNISSIYLFTHLRVFHCLSSKASLRLVRHIMYSGCERNADLFSKTTETLVNILPKSFRGRCPLTKLGAFGLTKYHDIRLCDESQTHENTGLLNHFVVYHCLSYPWANKLCNAMQAGDCDGSSQILFKPNEPIKAKKWLTTQGKLILEKRCLPKKKRKRVVTPKKKKN